MSEVITNLDEAAKKYALTVCAGTGFFQGQTLEKVAAAKFAELIVSECVMRISDWTVRKDDDLVLDCVDLNAALRDHFEFD